VTDEKLDDKLGREGKAGVWVSLPTTQAFVKEIKKSLKQF